MNDKLNKNNTQELYKQVKAYFRKHGKLNTIDWLGNISDKKGIVEVAFKNTRKGFYLNSFNLPVEKDDIVAVEASSGHDIGVVSLTGELAEKQFNRKVRNKDSYRFYKIWRKATLNDLGKFLRAKEKEIFIRNRARAIAKEMDLDMKISDVELQGDNTKAIFYFIADHRVDFRELIKSYAHEFQLKVEMKQIGARQEAALVGGLELCGREFCGSAWKTSFESVTSNAAKVQQLPLNDPKLMDHSGNFKCCLLYELDTYSEAWKEFPGDLPPLETANGIYYPHKIDVLKREIWFSISSEKLVDPVILSLKHVKAIIRKNKNGEKPFLDTGTSRDTNNQLFSLGSSENRSGRSKNPPKRKRKQQRKSKKKKVKQ